MPHVNFSIRLFFASSRATNVPVNPVAFYLLKKLMSSTLKIDLHSPPNKTLLKINS